MFAKKIRSVDAIVKSFSDTLSELDNRIAEDQRIADDCNEEIKQLETAKAEAMGSQARATAIKNNIKNLLGL